MRSTTAVGQSMSDAMILSCQLGEKHEWMKWVTEIPFLKFPPEWRVKVIPPFAGAIARFIVKIPDCSDTVSVYLDCYNCLGFANGPYWEVYPHHGDTGRCAMEDTETLLKMIADRSEGDDD